MFVPFWVVRLPVGGEEQVEQGRVAGGEVFFDLLPAYPQVEDSGGPRVVADRLLLERALVLVGLRPQPRAELADLHLPQLRGGDLRAWRFRGAAVGRTGR